MIRSNVVEDQLEKALLHFMIEKCETAKLCISFALLLAHAKW